MNAGRKSRCFSRSPGRWWRRELARTSETNAKRMECARFTGALDWILPRARTFAVGGITHSGAEAHALQVLARRI
jgi:hypothetical protein